jgi:hypothetical protein
MAARVMSPARLGEPAAPQTTPVDRPQAPRRPNVKAAQQPADAVTHPGITQLPDKCGGLSHLLARPG